MAKSKPAPAENLRANMARLMARYGDDTVSLAKKSGIPQRTVYNFLYTQRRASVEQAEKLAATYGFTGWQIIMPSLPDSPEQIASLVDAYLFADERDRDIVDRILRRTPK